mgnify:CR=1 FL=1
MMRSSTPGVTGGQGRGVSYSMGYQGPRYRVGAGGKLVRTGSSNKGGGAPAQKRQKVGISTTQWSRLLYGSGSKQLLTVAGVTDAQYQHVSMAQQQTLGAGSLGG